MKTNIIFPKIIILNIFYTSIFFLSISNIKSSISKEQFIDYFKDMTLDRMRQIYWNIVCDVNEKTSPSSLGEVLKKKYIEDTLHSTSRSKMIDYLDNSLKTLNSSTFHYYQDFSEFKTTIDEIDLFKYKYYNDLISIDTPKNFLVNFAINIEKYDRTKKINIDGISDYINYYKKETIVEYINDKLKEYTELNNTNGFNKIVLNNIVFKEKDIIKYCKTKSQEELIQIIYGFENYFFNVIENSDVISYNYYNHSSISTVNKEQLNQFIKLYNNEANITDIDKFIELIENRNFTYLCNDFLFDNMHYDEEFYDRILAVEKYHKRNINISKSLRGLEQYIQEIVGKKDENRKKIIEWGLSLYPELYGKWMFYDILTNDINDQYGKVKKQLDLFDRNDLLKFAYNIHTYQNNIKSIYNDDIYDLFRYNNDKLKELILSDTNLNQNLKKVDQFMLYGTLHNNIFMKYIENLERNQLKIITNYIVEFYYETIKKSLEDNERPSHQFTFTENLMNSETSEILSFYIDTMHDKIQATSDFFEQFEGNEIYGKDNFGFYLNIMDFFRSTDIYYLKLWLRKYETIMRKLNINTYMEGGLKYNFMNKNAYTKKRLLEIFDIYLAENPDLFLPSKFIEIVGLDNGITPHKKLVELFENLNDTNKEMIMKISYSLTGHFERKNIQTSFNITGFLNELNNTLYNSNKKRYIYYIFQLFRIINIFPELNNNKLFEIMCINNETRIINLYEIDYLTSIYERDKVKIAKNIQYFYNISGIRDDKNIDEMDEKELREYIFAFTNNKTRNNELRSRVLDGDFYLIFFDNYQHYLNNIDEEHISFIFNNIKKQCSTNQYPCVDISNATTADEKKMEIIEDIKTVQEFQNPNFFDKYFDFIYGMDGDELYKKLITLSTKEIKLYTLMSNIIKIETCDKNKTTNYDDVPEDIFFNIHYMSRNSLIRYILKVRNINKEMISSETLPLLIKKYMLDIGSDNIYDLTLY